ncbi:MAG: hypothetical protein E7651_02510 [Ruminococcaceae bacterium]|nr:hypothetical protein [Oscillospiraceae bacterium]MBQ8324122.1 hypothetical protein [Clostridia bacterium]
MKRLPILILISLLLTACVVMAAYLLIYHHSYELEYADLDIDETTYENGVLTVTVKSATAGEFLYRMIGAPNDKGEFELTFRGGKQGALAQTPGKYSATFTVEVPEEYKKVVCGKSTIYTISDEEGED